MRRKKSVLKRAAAAGLALCLAVMPIQTGNVSGLSAYAASEKYGVSEDNGTVKIGFTGRQIWDAAEAALNSGQAPERELKADYAVRYGLESSEYTNMFGDGELYELQLPSDITEELPKVGADLRIFVKAAEEETPNAKLTSDEFIVLSQSDDFELPVASSGNLARAGRSEAKNISDLYDEAAEKIGEDEELKSGEPGYYHLTGNEDIYFLLVNQANENETFNVKVGGYTVIKNTRVHSGESFINALQKKVKDVVKKITGGAKANTATPGNLVNASAANLAPDQAEIAAVEKKAAELSKKVTVEDEENLRVSDAEAGAVPIAARLQRMPLDDIYQTYLAEDEEAGYRVKVTAARGSIPNAGKLVVEEIAPESDQYTETMASLAGMGITPNGARALDISFRDLMQKRVQPKNSGVVSVQVSLANVPETADEASFAVYHVAGKNEIYTAAVAEDFTGSIYQAEDDLDFDPNADEEDDDEDELDIPDEKAGAGVASLDDEGYYTASFAADTMDPFYFTWMDSEVVVAEPEDTIFEFEGADYSVHIEAPAEAKLPADTELQVTEIEEGDDGYEAYREAAEARMQEEDSAFILGNARFFDITFVSGGEKIEPEAEVAVTIETEIGVKEAGESVQVLHFDEDAKEEYREETTIQEIKKSADRVLLKKAVKAAPKKAFTVDAPEYVKFDLSRNGKKSEINFKSARFSVYAIVEKTVVARLLTADGKTLNVSVEFDPREVLPKDAVLDVSEVTYEEDPEGYAKRNERLAGALFEEYGNVAITDVRYLNISIRIPDKAEGDDVQNWEEYEPVYPVEVKIDYTEPMDTTNPGEYTDYNDGSTKVTPDIGNHIVGVHYIEDGAEILDTVDENSDTGISGTVTTTESFSEYDFAYIYEYEIIDTDYNYEPSSIEAAAPISAVTVKAASGMLRAAGDTPAHSKTLNDNLDGTHKLSLTVTGDADTDSDTASNANVIIVFDTSNSMINYYVPMTNGARGSNNADGSNSYVLYRTTGRNPQEADDGYTGTVYRRNGNQFTEYTGQRYSKTIRRADAAEKVLYDFAHALYGYQNEDDPSTPDVDESKNIQTALITFNQGATTVQGWTSTETDITNRVSSTGAGGSKKLANSSGTNWEAALRRAQTLIGTDDSENDPTFVVFITDGQPTQWVGHTSDYDTTGEGYVQSRDEARAIQVACAATGTDSHGALFGIYAYGTEADYLDELMYYAYTGTARDMDPGTVETEGYYNASDSDALTEAINDIFSKIVNTLGITAVSISDGTTSQVQTTSGEISHLLEVDTSSYEYWLSFNTVNNKFTMKDLVSGEDVEYTVSSSGGNVTISWTKNDTDYSVTYEGEFSAGTARIKWDRATSFYNYAPPAATFTDPRVDWNLSSVGTLLDGVTYEVTFDVFPSQYTLDLIADLKNGYVTYNNLDANIKNYLLQDGNDYILATNTNATISYNDTRTDDGQQTTGYVNPEPVGTYATDTLSVTKDWSNDVDGRDKPEQLLMHVTRDATDRYELVLNEAGNWQDSSYISFGIVTVHNGVISVKTPGHDFSFSEPPEMEYYWELIAPTIRPMKINGVDTMLVKVEEDEMDNVPAMSGDNATAVGEDGYTYYKLTIGGTAMYYRVDNSIASLHAENHRRSYLQVVKTVEDPKEGDTFEFSITVKNALDHSETASEDNTDSDYYVWFSVYDTVGGAMVISDDLATGTGLQRETDASGYTGYYYIPSGNEITINMQHGYSLRFLNLPTESTYEISETLDGNYELGSIEHKRYYKEEVEGEGGSTSVVDKSEDTGTVDGLGISGTIDYADSRYEINYTNKRIVTDVSATKEWLNADGTTTVPSGASVVYTLYRDGELSGYTVTLDGTADGTAPTAAGGYESEGWKASFVNLPKYKVVSGEKVAIEYTIGETTTYPGYKASPTTPVADGGTITNTQEAVNVYALKKWKNADNTTNAPTGATVVYTLYTDGTATSNTVTLDGTPDTAPTGTAGYESEAWKATFINLPKFNADGNLITYTIAETTGYPGYKASTTQPVANEGIITNSQLYAEIKLKKIGDGNESTTLDDVQFELYSVWEGVDDPDNVKAVNINGAQVGTITTAGGGLATIGGLLPGTYYLVETVPASGYQILTEPVMIYIELSTQEPGYTVRYLQEDYAPSAAAGPLKPDGDGAYLITVNNPSGVALPSTGGRGTKPFTLFGILFILAGTFGFHFRRRFVS